MSDRRQSRSSLLFEHFDQAKHQGRAKQEVTAHNMLQSYRASVIEDQQLVSVAVGGTLAQAYAAAQKRLSRYMTGNELFPADLEEFFVAALPEPQQTRLRAAIVRSYGSQWVPLPSFGASAESAKACKLAKEFGEAMVAISPIFADGRVCIEDAAYLDEGIDALDDLISAAMALNQCFRSVRDEARAKGIRTGPATAR